MKRFACIVMVFITIGLLFSCGQERKKLQNDFDTKAIKLIEEFYDKFVFAEYNNFAGKQEYEKERILNSYCTKNLIDGYLIEDGYEDSESFYCLNAFVNGSQDYGEADRIIDIEAIGDGKYKVNYSNLGNQSLIIKVVVDDNLLKMEQIIY